MTCVGCTHSAVVESHRNIKEDMEFVKNKLNKFDNKNIEVTENSRINEQEMFAAVVKNELAEISSKAKNYFVSNFKNEYEKIKDKFQNNVIYTVVRNLVRQIRIKGLITREVAVKTKQFAFGKSQLDKVSNLLSASKLDSSSSDTAVRAIKTAVKSYESNNSAEIADYKNFKEVLVSERKKVI